MKLCVKYSVPFLYGDGTRLNETMFVVDVPAFDDRLLTELMRAHDAELGGIDIADAAGFDMISFTAGTREWAAVMRTTGLGPSPAHNALVVVHVSKL